MNLIIDVGNTYVKLAVFEKDNLLFDEVGDTKNLAEEVKKIFKKYTKIDWAIISSVVSLDIDDIKALTTFCNLHVLDHSSKTPFKSQYASPTTLGVDRIALAAAGYFHNQDKNTLVIDAGTCITYDMVTGQGDYLGGAISPGIMMRYKALNNQTSKLPLLGKEPPIDLIGTTTETSIHSGIINGVCAEIDGIIEQYSSRFEDLTVILTGGDAQFLSKRLKNTIFAHSKFLLEGLNYLLDYNKR
ncbi:type III pantothenate kinase [Maribacter sp. HTCC2170]|uniref:type III pantothenate kinase n=1 Tax=Maribacter sp. (strain HTCC2170 / KCCM 42371) TaxID=313603 RepID=UPI00006AE660|nr:type III pantothenate kinase [Maribacter sp. HTCC2170]EAR00514.1 putative regulatory protein [Maribacter sp. HTCC2170]